MTVTLPIACALSAPELQQRRSGLLGRFRQAVIEVRELKDGFAYQLPSEESWITEVAQLITLERQCCPFLTFNLRLEPANGPLWLELTGPEGTKSFLADLLTEPSTA
ncbi:MAG TPA: hypothetical protein VN643_03020 [Pyrinomonadaceae bacterium]|nr:hypothetical protein [Pyrinomonadaceae bacterium]